VASSAFAAYGQKYIGGVGELALIYPRTGRFDTALEPFYFAPGLRLHVLPFDLNAESLHGLNGLAPGVGLPSNF
jgi:5-methylcytosine-specific restriction enzyme subunit McrC